MISARWIFALGVVLPVCGWASGAGKPATRPIESKIIILDETRNLDLVSPKEFMDPPMTFLGGMDAFIKVQGDEIRNPIAYGPITVDIAVDGAGHSLEPPLRRLGDNQIHFNWERGKRDINQNWQIFSIFLAVSPRNVATINELKGRVEIRCATEQKTVDIPRIVQLLKKPIEHPILSQAGLKVVVDRTEQRSGDPSRELTIRYEGNIGAVRSLCLVDAAGKIISTDKSQQYGNEGETKGGWQLVAERPLDDSTTLRFALDLGQKTVTVPFDFKDVPLP